MSRREPVLLNSAAVTAGQLYVANTGPNGTFVPVVSGVSGTVSTLKTATGATIIKQIDVVARAHQTDSVGLEIFET